LEEVAMLKANLTVFMITVLLLPITVKGQNCKELLKTDSQINGECKVICKLPTPPEGVGLYVIDARSGEVTIYRAANSEDDSPELEEKRVESYRKNEKLLLVISNMNPFKYNYKLTVEEKRIPDTALLGFLQAFSPLIAGPIGTLPSIFASTEKINRYLSNEIPDPPAGCPDTTKATDAIKALNE
jgi:hypothetical protein